MVLLYLLQHITSYEATFLQLGEAGAASSFNILNLNITDGALQL